MALDADAFMRTGMCGCQPWPTALPDGRLRLCRLLRPADHKPVADGAGHTFRVIPCRMTKRDRLRVLAWTPFSRSRSRSSRRKVSGLSALI